MKQEKLTPAQQVFINEMVNGASQKQAYMTAYPGSSAEAAYSSASRLMDKPHIRQQIEQELEEVNWLKQQILLRHKSERLVAIATQQEALARIFSGEWVKTRTITQKGKTEVVRSEYDPNICLNAVRLDCKLTQEYTRLMAEMTDKGILWLMMQETEATARRASQPRPAPFPMAEDAERCEDEKHEEILADVSKSHQEPAAFPGNSCEKSSDDRGHSDKTKPDNCDNSCEILASAADCDSIDGEVNETFGDDMPVVQAAPAAPRHMNRKQRRAAEQYQKRLAEKEEKLRILMHS